MSEIIDVRVSRCRHFRVLVGLQDVSAATALIMMAKHIGVAAANEIAGRSTVSREEE